MSYKDIWFAHFERRLNQLIDAGCPEPQASDLAAEDARRHCLDSLIDQADNARKRAKEES